MTGVACRAIRVAAALGLVASTVGAAIRREGLPLLADLARITGERFVCQACNIRYWHRDPGELLHIEVQNSAASRTAAAGASAAQTPSCIERAVKACDYVHEAINDHSRVA